MQTDSSSIYTQCIASPLNEACRLHSHKHSRTFGGYVRPRTRTQMQLEHVVDKFCEESSSGADANPIRSSSRFDSFHARMARPERQRHASQSIAARDQP